MPQHEPPIAVKPICFIIPEGMPLEKILPLFGKKEESDVRKRPINDPKKGNEKEKCVGEEERG